MVESLSRFEISPECSVQEFAGNKQNEKEDCDYCPFHSSFPPHSGIKPFRKQRALYCGCFGGSDRRSEALPGVTRPVLRQEVDPRGIEVIRVIGGCFRPRAKETLIGESQGLRAAAAVLKAAWPAPPAAAAVLKAAWRAPPAAAAALKAAWLAPPAAAAAFGVRFPLFASEVTRKVERHFVSDIQDSGLLLASEQLERTVSGWTVFPGQAVGQDELKGPAVAPQRVPPGAAAPDGPPLAETSPRREAGLSDHERQRNLQESCLSAARKAQ